MSLDKQNNVQKSRKKRKARQDFQKKPIRKGLKSLRGQPECYDQVKKVVTISITPRAVEGLDTLSRERHISRSELIEQIGRGLIQLAAPSDLSS